MTQRARTVHGRIPFFAAQILLLAFIVFETYYAQHHGMLGSSHPSGPGDTALTGPWVITIVWVVSVVIALIVRNPKAVWLRFIAALIATVGAAIDLIGDASVVTAHHHLYTGHKWQTLLVFDYIAMGLSAIAILGAIVWAISAVPTDDSPSPPRQPSGNITAHP